MTRYRALLGALALGALAFGAFVGCSGTLDSLGGEAKPVGSTGGSSGDGGVSDAGTGEGGSAEAGATSGPKLPISLTDPTRTYPNLFKSLLGVSDAAIQDKLDSAFSQLFGDDADTSIYVKVGADQAYIKDVLHDDIRTEGLGMCMVVAVELDKQEVFDRLWTYAKANLLETSGAGRGYFRSICDDTTPCFDPYGMEQFVTALLFAHDQWGSTTAKPYGSEALSLLKSLRDKEAENGGVIDDIVSVFDARTALPSEQPTVATAGYTRSSLQNPAVFELWAQASGDSFWQRAADAARAGVVDSSDTTTGLWPVRNFFDGTPVPKSDFRSASYRTPLNLALDAAWGGIGSKEQQLADRVLAFFRGQGLTKYGAIYTLDGTVTDMTRQPGLIAANGTLVLAVTAATAAADQKDFVNAVWVEPIPTGQSRYFDGILYMTSLLILSGQYQIL
ncbi:MAG: glycosyl hydrolase family 8 [Polyangiaceae bacterium]